jgi:hypothetical protein
MEKTNADEKIIAWKEAIKKTIETGNSIDQYINKKNRSSTIFPLYFDVDIVNKLIFLGYWCIKHNNSVAISLTLRDIEGLIISKKDIYIEMPKSYEIDIFNYFKIEKCPHKGFIFSLEVEVFSENSPMFTYPAITLLYENKCGISAVHSCTRNYNEDETIADYALGLPQTGFDIILGQRYRNYFNFIGGKSPQYSLKVTLVYQNNKKIYEEILINQTSYSMHTFFIEDIFINYNIADGYARIIIEHNFIDIYPRFYCGYISKTELPTLTHSFFDTNIKYLNNNISANQLRNENHINNLYYDSAFSIPILPINNFDTDLITYDSNLNFVGDIIFEIRQINGYLINRTIKKSVEGDYLQGFKRFSVSSLFTNIQVDLKCIYILFVKFKSYELGFPARFKLGLNICKKTTDAIGSNICFASTNFNETLKNKPFTRRWLPIGGSNNFIVFIHNTTLEIEPKDMMNFCEIDFYNSDGEKYSINKKIRKHESMYIDITKDIQLESFFNGKIGWVFMKIDNYFFDSYYISTLGNQIGGDHAF